MRAKQLLSLILITFIFGFTFNSCSDDDDAPQVHKVSYEFVSRASEEAPFIITFKTGGMVSTTKNFYTTFETTKKEVGFTVTFGEDNRLLYGDIYVDGRLVVSKNNSSYLNVEYTIE